MRSRLSLIVTATAVSVQLGFVAPAEAGIFKKLTDWWKNQKSAVSSVYTPAPPPNRPAVEVLDATNPIERDLIKAAMEVVPVQTSYEMDTRKGFAGTARKLEAVQTDTHTLLDVSYTNQGLIFQFLFDEVAIQNPEFLLKDLILFGAYTDTLKRTSLWQTSGDLTKLIAGLPTPHEFAELLVNAQMGSKSARLRMAKIERDVLKAVTPSSTATGIAPKGAAFLATYSAELEKAIPTLEAAAKADQSARQKAYDKWKSETGTLDKLEALPEKLEVLILNNDRKGVADLVRTYLPWTVMEPMETEFWKSWLQSIEHPDMENTRIAFRGLDYTTDKIQRRQTPSGEIYGFMSTVLTKNQGNYNRRLRSLSTNRIKNGDIGGNLPNAAEEIKTVKMMDQFRSHATNPVASSFLSFTYSPAIARNFIGSNVIKKVDGVEASVANGALLAVKMDARRMIPNVTSHYQNEIELLAPLIVFPDEVVAFHEGKPSEVEYERFVKAVEEMATNNPIAKQFSYFSSSSNGDVWELFRNDGFGFLKTVIGTPGAAGGLCSRIYN